MSEPDDNQDVSGDSASAAKRACVIGWPIKHSRSPLIHGHWLKTYGIEGSYIKKAIEPAQLKDFLGNLRAHGFTGCNVTVPHKEAAFALADEHDANARAIGAANTFWLEGDRLCAGNTDGAGFMAHLAQSAPGWDTRDGPVSILGAGGAARAIIHGFLEADVSEIRLFNRTRARAEELAAHFGSGVRVMDWEQRGAGSRQAITLVNTTTLGMSGSAPLELDLTGFRDDCVIADIVYAPLETKLLARARARGLRTVDGLGMLLHQAVPGFEKWFGYRPQVTTELRDLIVADILK